MRFFADLISQPPLSTLGQVEAILGRQLIRLEAMRIEIDTLKDVASRDRWQERLAALVVFALVGAVIGCVAVTRAVGQ